MRKQLALIFAAPGGRVGKHGERKLQIPFEQAWDSYVAELSKSFFVINNVSKESRMINVSFSTDRPGKYIDCGQSLRTSHHPGTGDEEFAYNTADSSSFNAGQDGTNILWTVNRKTRLEGRAYIYIAPEGGLTLIRVNAKYVWSVTTDGRTNTGLIQPTQTMSIDLSSSVPGADTEVKCRSLGTLESELLNLI